jgi:hypothetical protein
MRFRSRERAIDFRGVLNCVIGLALILGSRMPANARQPEVATVGLYLAYVPELDLKSNSYVADLLSVVPLEGSHRSKPEL